MKKDTNDDLFQLGIKRARELYDEQIKDGFVVLDEEEKNPKKIDKKEKLIPKSKEEGNSSIKCSQLPTNNGNRRQSSRLKGKKVYYNDIGIEDDTNENKKEDEKNESKTKKVYSSGPHYPMLAYDYKKKKEYIKFPCYVQPKLDGVRAVGVGINFYSRNWIKFPELDHIRDEMSKIETNIILDGELYTNDINFESIVGLVRKGNKTSDEIEKTKKIYYNVFDCIDKKLPFKERYEKLEQFFLENNLKYLKLVKTEYCKTESEIETFLDKYIKEGYEGVIIRNIKGKYEENTRSTELQKLKRFVDEEFEIIGYQTPTIGKEVGCVIWECKTKEGKSFTVRPEGSYQERKKLYKEGKKNIGKLLTVRFQEYTKDNIPRFPVG